MKHACGEHEFRRQAEFVAADLHHQRRESAKRGKYLEREQQVADRCRRTVEDRGVTALDRRGRDCRCWRQQHVERGEHVTHSFTQSATFVDGDQADPPWWSAQPYPRCP